jgi:crotonobetainyl-CoA:carnitine CoA-transferase CaiB-like acyl-CoA transferase
MFERLTDEAMGRPELRAEFRTMDDRIRRRADLDRRVQEWVGGFDSDEALKRLDAAGVPCSRVNSVKDIFADEHMRARDNLVPVPVAGGDPVWMPGVVPRLSATPGAIRSPGPAAVGEHNEEVYCGRLGLTRDDLAALRQRGIV